MGLKTMNDEHDEANTHNRVSSPLFQVVSCAICSRLYLKGRKSEREKGKMMLRNWWREWGIKKVRESGKETKEAYKEYRQIRQIKVEEGEFFLLKLLKHFSRHRFQL